MRIPLLRLAIVSAIAVSAIAQNLVPIPPHAAIYNGFSRGYNFTSATNFIIARLELPLDAVQAGDTAGFLVRKNGTVVLHSIGNVGPSITTSILVNPGDVMDIIGNWSPAVPANFTAHNSYGNTAPYATTIEGVPHTLTRTGWQWDIGDPVYAGTYLTPTTGQIGRVLMYTTPQNGLFANFTANVTSGATPLTVNFSDTSFSSDPGGVTGWAWDLDGDSIIDSTVQNPTFVYTTCGSYNVSLTVTDGAHPPSTLTRPAFIVTDLITANFTHQVIGPLLVQFTDTSNVPATAWAWDLNGDSIVDSTVQNPVWLYANTNPVNVTLTATRLCAPPSTVTKSVVPVQSLSHNVAPNNGLSTGASVYFDVNVTNPEGLGISSLDVFGSVINTPFTVDAYVKPGTYLGFEGTAAEWVKIGTASGTSASATTLPSNAAFPQALYLPPGLFGMKLLYNGVGPRYQTGTANVTVSNGDVSLTLGSSRGTTVAAPWSGSNIANRWWSGTFYYGTFNVTGLAGQGSFAPGCAGSLGVSHLSGNLPQLGSTFNLTVNNLPQSVAILLVGFSNTSSAFGPLPIDVAPFGAPGCFGRVSPDVTQFVIGGSNSAVWSFSVPASASFAGVKLFAQPLSLDPGFNALGGTFGDAGALQLGN